MKCTLWLTSADLCEASSYTKNFQTLIQIIHGLHSCRIADVVGGPC